MGETGQRSSVLTRTVGLDGLTPDTPYCSNSETGLHSMDTAQDCDGVTKGHIITYLGDVVKDRPGPFFPESFKTRTETCLEHLRLVSTQ